MTIRARQPERIFGDEMFEIATGQTELELRRDVITITIRCRDRYEAMLLYDKMVAEAKQGVVTVTMTTKYTAAKAK